MLNEPTLMLPDFGKNPVEYLKEVQIELKKVIWPKREEVVKMTGTVIIVSSIVAVYIGGLDSLFTQLFSKIIE